MVSHKFLMQDVISFIDLCCAEERDGVAVKRCKSYHQLYNSLHQSVDSAMQRQLYMAGQLYAYRQQQSATLPSKFRKHWSESIKFISTFHLLDPMDEIIALSQLAELISSDHRAQLLFITKSLSQLAKYTALLSDPVELENARQLESQLIIQCQSYFFSATYHELTIYLNSLPADDEGRIHAILDQCLQVLSAQIITGRTNATRLFDELFTDQVWADYLFRQEIEFTLRKLEIYKQRLYALLRLKPEYAERMYSILKNIIEGINDNDCTEEEAAALLDLQNLMDQVEEKQEATAGHEQIPLHGAMQDRETLKSLRESFKLSCDLINDQITLSDSHLEFFLVAQKIFSDGIRALMKSKFARVHRLLGTSHCDFTVLVEGSLVRDAMGPYSDIEIVILIKDLAMQAHPYFIVMQHLISLEMSVLCEPWNYQLTLSTNNKRLAPEVESCSIQIEGFQLDGMHYFNIPILSEHLITTPKTLAQNVIDSIVLKNWNLGGTIAQALLHVERLYDCYEKTKSVSKDCGLYDEYQRYIQNKIESTQRGPLSLLCFTEHRRLSEEKDTLASDAVYIKKDYLCYLDYWLADMALFHEVAVHGAEDILSELVSKNVIDSNTAAVIGWIHNYLNFLRVQHQFLLGKQPNSKIGKPFDAILAADLSSHARAFLDYLDNSYYAKLFTAMPVSSEQFLFMLLPEIKWSIVFKTILAQTDIETDPDELCEIHYINQLEGDIDDIDQPIIATSYLKANIAAQLFQADGSLQPIPENQPGRHHVLPIRALKVSGNSDHEQQPILCWAKFYPEQPLTEYAVTQLVWQVIGAGVAPNQVVKVIHPSTQQVYAVQLCLHVAGTNLHDVLVSDSSRVDQLSMRSYTQALLRVLLTNPEDDKDDDYIIDNNQHFIRIDNERAFFDAAIKIKSSFLTRKIKGEKMMLQVKSILFSLPQLYQQLDSEVLVKFQHLCPYEVLKNWLNGCCEMHRTYQLLFDEPTFIDHFKHKNPGMSLLTFALDTHQISQLLQRFQAIQTVIDIAQSLNRTVSGVILLGSTQPQLAKYFVKNDITVSDSDSSSAGPSSQRDTITILAHFHQSTGHQYLQDAQGYSMSSMNALQAISQGLGLKKIMTCKQALAIRKGEQHSPVQQMAYLETLTEHVLAELEENFFAVEQMNDGGVFISRTNHLPPSRCIMLVNNILLRHEINPLSKVQQKLLLKVMGGLPFHQLDFSFCKRTSSNELLRPILKGAGKHLLSLTLIGEEEVGQIFTTTAISDLVTFNTNLHILQLANLINIDKLFYHKAKRSLRSSIYTPAIMPNLVRLEIHACPDLHDLHIDAPLLEELYLSSIVLTNEQFVQLTENLGRSLRQLTLRNIPSLTKLSGRLPTLKSLTLAQTAIERIHLDAPQLSIKPYDIQGCTVDFQRFFNQASIMGLTLTADCLLLAIDELKFTDETIRGFVSKSKLHLLCHLLHAYLIDMYKQAHRSWELGDSISMDQRTLKECVALVRQHDRLIPLLMLIVLLTRDNVTPGTSAEIDTQASIFVQCGALAISVLVASGVSLAGLALQGINICGANLLGAILSYTDLSRSYLQGVLLQNSRLDYANLTGCCLSNIVAIIEVGSYITRLLVTAVAYSPDGNEVAIAADMFGRFFTYDIRVSKELNYFDGMEHQSPVCSIMYSPQGDRLASGSNDHTVREWSRESAKCLQVFRGHNSGVTSVAYAPDGDKLASASHDKTIRVWSISSGECLHLFEEHTSIVWSVAFAPHEDMLASVSADGTVRLWSTESGKCQQVIDSETSSVKTVAYAPREAMLAYGGLDGIVRVLSTESGVCLQVFEGHTKAVLSIAYSPQGDKLASGSADGAVRLWSITSGDCLQVFEECMFPYLYASVKYSPHGDKLLSTATTGLVKEWSIVTGLGGTLLKLDMPPHLADYTSGDAHGVVAFKGYGGMIEVSSLGFSKHKANTEIIRVSSRPCKVNAYHHPDNWLVTRYNSQEYSIWRPMQLADGGIKYICYWRTDLDDNLICEGMQFDADDLPEDLHSLFVNGSAEYMSADTATSSTPSCAGQLSFADWIDGLGIESPDEEINHALIQLGDHGVNPFAAGSSC